MVAMARTLYPVPFQTIWDHPDFELMPCSAAGMLLRLVEHYWRGDCRSIPIAEHELRAVCRAHLAAWKDHKEAILKVFNDSRPELDAYHRLRVTKATTIRFVSAKGGGARSAQAAKRKIDDYVTASAPQITSFHQLGHVPQREPAPPRPQTPDKRPPRPLRTDTLTRR